MDKNTITGLVLIGILLVGFSFLSRLRKKNTTILLPWYSSRRKR